MNTEPPIGEVPSAAEPGPEPVTGMSAGGDLMPVETVPPVEAPMVVAETVFVETSDAPFATPFASETTAEYVIGDGLADAGAQPEAPAELSAVAEVADMADAYSAATGAELAASVDAAEIAAQVEFVAEEVPSPPVDAPVAVAETVFVETSDAPFVAPVVSETAAEYVIGDGLADAGAQPEAPAELSAVAEVADMADAYSAATGAELAASVDAAEIAAQVELVAEEVPAPPVEEPAAVVGETLAAAEAEDLDDLLPGVSPVVDGGEAGDAPAMALEVAVLPDDGTPEVGLGFGELVAQAEEVADLAAEAAYQVDEAAAAPVPEPVLEPEPVMDAVAEPVPEPAPDPEPAVAAAPEPVSEPVTNAEDEADLDDLLPGVNPVPEGVIAESIAPVVPEVPVIAAVPELVAAPADEDEELDDLLPEVDPLMVAMVVEDAAESATTEAEAQAALDVVDAVVQQVIADADADKAEPLVNVYPATPGELWLKLWARSLDFWMSPVTGAGKKD